MKNKKNNELEVKIKAYDYLPCHTEVFTINGIKARLEDFGENKDFDASNAEPWSCACHAFKPKSPTKLVLDKYGITNDEYRHISKLLERELFVGKCSLCV